MRRYLRVRLGSGGQFASACLSGGFIGVDFGLAEDLAGKLPEEWRDFNARYVPKLQAQFPNKSKISAGLNCGAIWSVCKGANVGDRVLCPDEAGALHIGEIVGGYEYHPEGPLPHRRRVEWIRRSIGRGELSAGLWASAKTPQTVIWLDPFGAEIDQLVGEGGGPVGVVATNPEIEDPIAFAMEKHLEEFLVTNWSQTVLARDWRIFEEEGEVVGQQYQTDSGPADILAVSHDGKRLLVVELKRGRASDVVVGQVLRYMGFVDSELAEPGQSVEGVIIALEDDPKLRRALRMVPSVRFMRYRVSFTLSEG